MPALTSNIGRVAKNTRLESIVELTITDNVRLFAGSLAMCVAAGSCSPAVAVASNRGVWGVAKLNPLPNPDGTMDGSWNNTLVGHTLGFYKVLIVEGTFNVPFSAVNAIANNGIVTFSVSDNDTHVTQAANEPRTGLHHEFLTTTLGVVEMSCAIGIGI